MKTDLKNILIPIDFNAPSQRAVYYAIDVAKKIEGTITLLHVIETKGIINEFFQSGNEIVKITEKVKSKLDTLARKIASESKIEINTMIERGKIYQKILDVADELNARFVILGENHEYTEEDNVLGTTVFHVTLKSKSPVLIVKGKNKKFGGNFLVPMDLTKETKKQLLASIAYGVNYNASINLVSVKIANIKMRTSLIQKKLRKNLVTLKENNIEADYKLFNYSSDIPPYKRVLEYAKESKADLILLLTHQEGYTYDNYIGAFAHHIINESDIPVLSLTADAVGLKMEDLFKPILDPMGYLFK